MFDDNRDLNRDLERHDAMLNSPAVDGSGYGPLVALAAIAAIVGGLFFFAPSADQTQVAANNPSKPPVTRTAPAPVTPAPQTTAPQSQ